MADSGQAGQDFSRRVSKIQEVLDQIGQLDDYSDSHREQAQSIVGQLKEKQRKTILKSALTTHLEAEALKPYQAELIKMQAHLEERKRKAIILFDGRDASGKGGTIRRVARYMNEKHYRVIALGKPSEVQRTELHMKRYIEHFPHAGEIALFDRSWYNRAMVEPVMEFCTRSQYRQFMNRVNDYEESFVSDGTTLIKLYFSVSRKEQAKRFKRRLDDPLRSWKLSEVDMQAQEMWDEFTKAKYRLLKKTHTKKNPWYIIRSDDKHLARLETIKLILNLIKYRGRSRTLNFELNPDVVISGDREIQIMDKQMARKGAYKE
ncbi:MAG: polyphosphate kinase 2 [Gammaproteobacteria bacterium]|jgi:polyphosphate kinase|nr:polyphosphate kinase 2 [Gammaproteobacteria bacterium]MBT4492769.1 polyphosphate kinase 2 [Gammaproteobacteria bacterium]